MYIRVCILCDVFLLQFGTAHSSLKTTSLDLDLSNSAMGTGREEHGQLREDEYVRH